MNKIGSIGLAILLGLTCVGCTNENKEPEEEVVTKPVEDLEAQQEVHKFEEEDFESFFKAYFSYTDSEILVLNRQYLKESDIYWQNLNSNYSKLIGDKLGKYLSSELNERIKKQYAHEDIMLPKYSMINNYMVSGKGEVENIEIKSTRTVGESIIYELAVTTSNKCYPVEEFAIKHDWGREEDYFVERGTGTTPTNTTNQTGAGVVNTAVFEALQFDAEEIANQDFIYSANTATDKMKLEQNFWVTVKDGEKLEIEGIRPAGNWEAGSRGNRDIINTQYIDRIAFAKEVNKKEDELVRKIFTGLFSQPRSAFENMCVAYDTGFEAYKNNLDAMGFKNVFVIEEKSYKQAYNREISPYKDEIIKINVDEEKISIEPSAYSTEHQPRYVVTVPAETLQNNNKIVYYNYKYYVGMENGKVEQLNFMAMKEADEFEYICGMDEEQVKEVGETFAITDINLLLQASKDTKLPLSELVAMTEDGAFANPVAAAESLKQPTETEEDVTN